MNTQELAKLYNAALNDMTDKGLEIDRVSQIKNMLACYLRMFKETPHFVSTDYDEVYKGVPADKVKEIKEINVIKTLNNIIDKFGNECYYIRNFESKLVMFDHCILTVDDDSVYGCYNQEFFPKEILDCVVYTEKEDTRYMSYVTNSSNGFNTMSLEVKRQDVDLDLNYNDDLPHDKILEFINGESSGIMIFHGIPGTGNLILKIFSIFIWLS